MEYVVPIQKASEDAVLETGRKCVQLRNLLLAGFNVPQGFCITASGYEYFVEHNNLQKEISQFVTSFDHKRNHIQKHPEPGLLPLFQEARFPNRLKEEIVKAYRNLGVKNGSTKRVAVRSSGLIEDGRQASFAGQFETYLNIWGEKELLEQIKRCWASFWQHHSLCYQKDRVGSDSPAGVALLVQEMIPARIAGVLFTRNPIQGHPDEMIIEAGWGLGEAIVSGIVKPDHFVVNRQSLKIVHSTIQDKHIQVVMNKKRGCLTKQIPVPPEKRRISCLSDQELGLLCKTCKEIHEYWGTPQDIEWAFYRKKLYLLQTRPITTLSACSPAVNKPLSTTMEGWASEFDTPSEKTTEWTSATISEMLPGVLSPLTLSLMPALEYGFQKPTIELGLLRPALSGQPFSFLGFFYNRAYLNLTLIRSLVRQVPLISPDTMERILRGDESSIHRPKKQRFIRDMPHMLRIGYHALQLAQRLKPAGEALIEKGVKQYTTGQGWDVSKMESREILNWLETIQHAAADIYALHITASEFGELTFQLMKKLTKRWATDEHGVLASQLITGSYNPFLARPFYGIWGLAQRVKASNRLQKLFNSSAPGMIMKMLKNDPSSAARTLLLEFQEFLRRYGYRSRYGAELMHPTWEDEAGFILSLVKIYTKSLLKINPWEIERGQAQRRSLASQKLESHLNPLQRKIVRELLQLMHVFIPLRQNMRALSLMHAHLARRLTHELGRRFNLKGLLGHSGDIYFLTIDEIMSLGLSTPIKPPKTQSSETPLQKISSHDELKQCIERRKQEYKNNLSVTLPEYCVGKPLPISSHEKGSLLIEEKRLRGLAASPGRITGSARLVTTHSRDVEVQEGDILVIPGMDAGWTPLFLSAAAIVSERGGVLSHGSIAAREYGLPAVTNAKMATQLIRNGQVITVDGDRGEVWL